MNTLLDLMHQVWHRRTPAHPAAASASVVLPHRAAAVLRHSPSAPAGNLWAWYQSRCTAESHPAAER